MHFFSKYNAGWTASQRDDVYWQVDFTVPIQTHTLRPVTLYSIAIHYSGNKKAPTNVRGFFAELTCA
jgi:hypothetical protein